MCGNPLPPSKFFTAKLEKRRKLKCCSDCAMWRKLAEDRPDTLEIAGGIAYKVNPYAKKKWGTILGSDGKTHYFLKKDLSLTISNDVWKIGEIPQHFRDELKDTGWWITDRKYANRCSQGRITCKTKMCYNRYRCLWFDYTSEFEDGPFNTVPKDYVIGTDKCPSFVDVLCVKDFDAYFNPKDMLSNET